MTTSASLLRDLVRLPSINPMGRSSVDPTLHLETRVTAYLTDYLRSLNVAVQRQNVAPGRDNLVAVWEPSGPPASTLLWEAHQDTVPVDGMTIDPFGGEVRDGRLYGRGACDVKGGLTAMLIAFTRLVREKPSSASRVILAFTVDEEHTFLGVQRLVRNGLIADMAIVAEPTCLHIVPAHKGVARWTLTTVGRSCHSSRPEEGINAVYRMGRLVTLIEEFAANLRSGPTDPRLGPATLSVGRIAGGASVNIVPDFCRIEMDRRLLPGESPNTALQQLTDFLRSRLGNTVPFEVSAPWLHCPALSAERSTEAVQRLGQAIDTVIGSHQVEAVPYGTDASTLAEAGIPSVVFGPGDIAQAHTRDEWIDLNQLDQASEILYVLATS